MSPAPTLPDKVVAVHQALETARIPHAFGGALALAYYAEPRATIDIDVNVFVAPADYRRATQPLAALGIGDQVDGAAIERDGQCRLWWEANPVDLFFAYDELHDRMREDRRMVPFADTRIPILAPEHLLICKVVFDRPKDWLDIEQMLVSLPDLPFSEINDTLGQLLGQQDPRLRRLSELASRWDG